MAQWVKCLLYLLGTHVCVQMEEELLTGWVAFPCLFFACLFVLGVHITIKSGSAFQREGFGG